MDACHHLCVGGGGGGVKRGSALQGLWRGLTIALHSLPMWGYVLGVGGWGGKRFSNRWLRGEGNNVALGLQKRILFIKMEGKVDGGWDSNSQGEAGGVLATHSPLQCILQDGAGTERSASSASTMGNASVMNPFRKCVKRIATSSRLPLWLATLSQRCNDS